MRTIAAASATRSPSVVAEHTTTGMGAICAFRSYVVGSTLWFQWTSALAMVFWGMGQSWLTRKATPGVR